MAVYVVASALPLALAGIAKRRYRAYGSRVLDGKSLYAFCVALAFTLVMAARATSVGVDTAPYSRIYAIIGSSGSIFEAIERAPLSARLYVTLCYAMSRISPDPRLMIVVTSAFVNVFFFKYAYEASDDVVVSSCCYVGLTLFYCSMNGNRQCMAMALLMNALWALDARLTSPKGWLAFLAAIGIHETAAFGAVIVAGMAIAKRSKDPRALFAWSAAVTVAFDVGFTKILPAYLKAFPRYVTYVNGTNRYSILSDTGGGRIAILYAFLLAIVVAWVATYRVRDDARGSYAHDLLPGITFGMAFGLLNAKNELANRCLWYYLALFVTFVPSLTTRFKGASRRIVTFCATGALYAYSFVSLMENQNGVVPYVAFWNAR